jgi:TP901 family phage tail tape measure protein
MNIGSLTGQLVLEDHFSSTVGLALTKMETASMKMQTIGRGMMSAGQVMSTAITLPLVALAGVSVKAFADFDKKMTESTAIMADMTDEMRKRMGDAARDVAKTSTFSAAQAAEAYYFLASAGLDAAASIEAMPKMAKFAQAGNFDLALATDLLTDAQSALGMTIRDDVTANIVNMVKVSDVLVKANTLANASVQQFSEALTTKAGNAMKDLNIDIEDGVAVLAVWADQGVKGTMAGERFAIVTRDLQTAYRKNTDAFKAMNIEVFDGTGKFRNMADIIEQMETALGGMSHEAKSAALAQLGFTDRSIAATRSLMGNSEAIRTYTTGLRDAGGITESVAEKQLKTFSNQMTLMKNRLMDSAITMGQSLMPVMQTLVGMLEKGINQVSKFAGWFSDLDPKLQKVVITMLALSAATGPVLWATGALLTGFAKLIPLTVSLASAVTGLQLSMTGLLWPVRVLIAQIGIFGVTVGVKTTAVLLWSKVVGLLTGALATLTGALKGASVVMLANPIGLVISLVAGLTLGMRALTGSWEFLTKPLMSAWNLFKDLATVVTDLVTPAISGLADVADAIFTPGFERMTRQIDSATWALKALWTIASTMPGPIRSILEGKGAGGDLGLGGRARRIRLQREAATDGANNSRWEMPLLTDPGMGSGMMFGGPPTGFKSGAKSISDSIVQSEDYKDKLEDMRSSLLTTGEGVKVFREVFASLTPVQLQSVDVQRRVVEQFDQMRAAGERLTPAMRRLEDAYYATTHAETMAGVARLESMGVASATIESTLRMGMSQERLAESLGVTTQSLEAYLQKQQSTTSAAEGLFEFEAIAKEDAEMRKRLANEKTKASNLAVLDMEKMLSDRRKSSYQLEMEAIDQWAKDQIANTAAVGADLTRFTDLVEAEAARMRAAITTMGLPTVTLPTTGDPNWFQNIVPRDDTPIAWWKKLNFSAKEYGETLSILSAGFVRLADVAGESLSSIFRGFSQAIVQLETAFNMTAQIGGAASNKDTQAKIGGNWGVGSVLFSSTASGMQKAAAGVAGAISVASGAMQAWNSGSALGGAMAGAQAGAMFGPWGAAIGGVAGGILGLINRGKAMREENKKATASIQDYKGELEKLYGSLTNIAQLDKALGTDVAAGWGHQGVKGLEAFGKSAEELAKRLAEIHDEMSRIASEGGLASAALIQFRNAMSTDETVQAFVLGQVQQAGGNIGGMLGSLQASATARDQKNAKDKGDEEWQSVIGKIQLTTTGAQAMASVLIAAWDGSAEGLRAMQPSLDILQRAMENSGVEGSAAFQQIGRMAAMAADEVQGPLIDAINFGTGALTNMHNAGFLTQETFSGIVDEIMAQRAALLLTGASSEDINRVMQPSLQRIWELHKDTGLAIDDETTKLLAQAEAQGTVGDKFRSATDRMVIALESIATMFKTVFGDTLIAEIKRGTDDAETRLGRLTRDREINVRTRFDGSEGNPGGGAAPGVGSGGTAELVVDGDTWARAMVPRVGQEVINLGLG